MVLREEEISRFFHATWLIETVVNCLHGMLKNLTGGHPGVLVLCRLSQVEQWLYGRLL